MDPDHVSELFAGFGPVSVRRMFGGFGIYAGGRMFGLAYDGLIYLKADAATVPAFEGEGQGPFSYQAKGGKRVLTSYWRLPERLYDDPEELARWARDAVAAAQRSAGPVKGVRRRPAKRPASRPRAKSRGRSRR